MSTPPTGLEGFNQIIMCLELEQYSVHSNAVRNFGLDDEICINTEHSNKVFSASDETTPAFPSAWRWADNNQTCSFYTVSTTKNNMNSWQDFQFHCCHQEVTITEKTHTGGDESSHPVSNFHLKPRGQQQSVWMISPLRCINRRWTCSEHLSSICLQLAASLSSLNVLRHLWFLA